MQNTQPKNRCYKVIVGIDLIMLGLLISASFYQGNTISLSQQRQQQLSTTPIQEQVCSQLCPQQYHQAVDDRCCMKLSLATCKLKSSCKANLLQIMKLNIEQQQKQLNVMLAGIVFFFFNLTVLCCLKLMIKKEEFSEVDRSMHASIAGLRAYVHGLNGSLEDESTGERRSTLREPFLAENTEETCAICLQGLDQTKVIELNCQHLFHQECIVSWIQLKSSCPVCRAAQIHDPLADCKK